MRFIYGFISGVLVSMIAAILYLAFAGGEYLLQLSPRYHDMVSTISGLQEAKQQRDQLASRLEALAGAFDTLTRRFDGLQQGAPSAMYETSPAGTELPAPAKPAEGTKPSEPSAPKPRPAEPAPSAPSLP